MNQPTTIEKRLPVTSESSMAKVRILEAAILKEPQISIHTHHVIHGGVYARTIMIPAGAILSGALIKVATTLIISGDVLVYMGDESIELHGHNILAGSAGRKQAFVAITDAYLTMMFKTQARTVAEAEEEFTDEAPRLMSRSADAKNTIIITEE